MSDRMHPEDIQAIAVHTAGLIDAKIGEIKAIVQRSLDAGHAAVTRAAQAEDRLEQLDWAVRKVWREVGLPEDDFPRRHTG